MNGTRQGDSRFIAVPRTWWLVAVQSARDLWAGSVLEWAASLAFYALLSLFPLLIALLIVASYVTDATWASEQAVTLLGQYLPSGEKEIRDIVEGALIERRHVGILSFVIFLFTGRRVLGVLTKGLNHVSDVDERSDPYKRRILVEAGLLGGLVTFALVALAAQPILRWAWDGLSLITFADRFVVWTVRGLLRVLFLMAAFVLVYVYVPQGRRLWRPAMTGAATATLLFLVAEGVFTLMIDRIWNTLGLIYGPIALAALLLTWAWYVSLVTLIGGGVASHVKVMVIEKTDMEQAHKQHV